MFRRPPSTTRTDTLFPYTTLCRSGVHRLTCDGWHRDDYLSPAADALAGGPEQRPPVELGRVAHCAAPSLSFPRKRESSAAGVKASIAFRLDAFGQFGFVPGLAARKQDGGGDRADADADRGSGLGMLLRLAPRSAESREGKSVSVRVDLGGGRVIKKKK